MQHNVYVYIFIMFAVTYLIRVLPLTVIRKPIRSWFIRSFLVLRAVRHARGDDLPGHPRRDEQRLVGSAGADCGRGARAERAEPADRGGALLRGRVCQRAVFAVGIASDHKREAKKGSGGS